MRLHVFISQRKSLHTDNISATRSDVAPLAARNSMSRNSSEGKAARPILLHQSAQDVSESLLWLIYQLGHRKSYVFLLLIIIFTGFKYQDNTFIIPSFSSLIVPLLNNFNYPIKMNVALSQAVQYG